MYRSCIKKAVQALGLALLLCLASSTAWGYSFMRGNPKWSFSKMPITWQVRYEEGKNLSGRSLDRIKKLVDDAFKMWEAVDCSYVLFKYGGTTTATADNRRDGKNVIEWVVKLPGDRSPSAVGLGGPQFSGGGQISEASIWLKTGISSDSKQVAVLAHELGHTLGIGHTDVRGALMYPVGGPKLVQDDKNAICASHPVSKNTCSDSSECPNGLRCNGGRCGRCGKDEDCGSGRYCDRGSCKDKCQIDDDCSPKGRLCVKERCINCSSDKDCGDKRFCQAGLCYDKCETDDDCGSEGNKTCRSNGRCVERGGCQKNEECESDEYCDANQCVSTKGLGAICQGAGDCPNGTDCVPHLCEADLDCTKGYTCKKSGEETEGRCTVTKDGKDETASVCGLTCEKSEDCPINGQCRAFGSRNYCYPERRKPPKPKPEKPEPEEGCGCNASAQGPNTPGNGLWILAGSLVLLGLRRRRRR